MNDESATILAKSLFHRDSIQSISVSGKYYRILKSGNPGLRDSGAHFLAIFALVNTDLQYLSLSDCGYSTERSKLFCFSAVANPSIQDIVDNQTESSREQEKIKMKPTVAEWKTRMKNTTLFLFWVMERRLRLQDIRKLIASQHNMWFINRKGKFTAVQYRHPFGE